MKIKANAKINLCLSVCGKREDGYHLIDTVMHSISLFDVVELEKADKISVECSNDSIYEKDNIAYKAAVLFLEKTGALGGVKITIEKNIPTCAGLGGGSADAAAVLCGLDKLFGTNLSYEALCEMAVVLGADVPFFIKGGCQRATGIGEILESHKPLKKGYFVLVKADQKPSTAEMYRKIDSQKTVLADTEDVLNAIAKNDLDLLSKKLYNAFLTVWPDSRVKAELLKTAAKTVSLTGSGPTWFVLFETLKEAQALKSHLEEQNTECYLATPENFALKFE